MTWNFPSLSICVRIAPSPPSSVAEPVLASTMSAYCLSALGYATTGFEINWRLRVLNALRASSGSVDIDNNVFISVKDLFHHPLKRGWAPE